MFSRSVGLAATCCALGANAFLLPPNVAPGPGDHHRADINNNPFVSVNPKNQILELPCSSCAFPAQKSEEKVASEDDVVSIQGGANNLILNFTVSEDGQVLNLNDVPIYPVQAGFDALGAEKAHSWIVKQLPASASIEDLEADENMGVPLRISGAGTKMSKTKIISANGDEIIPLDFQILSLEDQPMTIDEIAIQLLRDENNELLILSVEPAHENMMDHFPMSFGPPPPHPPPPHHHPEDGPEGHPEGPKEGRPPKECNSLPAPLCRFFHAVDEKFEAAKHNSLEKFRGCGGRKGGPPHKMPGHIKPHFGPPNAEGDRELVGGMPPHGPPHGPHGHHKGPHDHHGHHGPHHRHAVAHAFFQGVVAILIPVMAGIFVGLTVSMVGLLVGKLISLAWIKFVRGGKRGYASVALDEESAEKEADVKAEQYEEAPPVYEDAPAYELADEKEQK